MENGKFKLNLSFKAVLIIFIAITIAKTFKYKSLSQIIRYKYSLAIYNFRAIWLSIKVQYNLEVIVLNMIYKYNVITNVNVFNNVTWYEHLKSKYSELKISTKEIKSLL